MHRVAFLLSLLCCAGPSALAQHGDVLPVVPYPQEVAYADGAFPLAPGGTTLHLSAADTTGLQRGLQELRETLRLVAGGVPTGTGGAALVWLGLPDQDPAFTEMCRQAGIWPDERIGAEGYVLRIEPDRILLAAAAPAGLYYGVQTLKQLLRGYRTQGALPALRIADWPALRYRGVMDDISRGPVPNRAFFEEQIRRLAEMKVNLLMYYTEHVVKTEQHPAFAPEDGAVSIEEWRALAAYARAHHIRLVGNFQSLGHFEKILAHPAYRALGENGRLLSPVLPESIDFLRDIYAEMVPAFDAPFFHVNGDEPFDLGRGASKGRVDSLGKAVVYAEHMGRIRAALAPYGVRMMMWGDMALQHPEVLGLLEKDVIVATWAYSPLDSYAPLITPFQEAGFDVFVAPGVLNSNRILPDFLQARANIAGFAAEGAARGVMGLLNTVWDDGGSALFARDWYGVAYGADQSWNPGGDRRFDDRFSRGLYGDPRGGLPAALGHLMALGALDPTDGLNEAVLWQQLVPEPGQTLHLSLDGWDAVLAHCDSAAQALRSAAPLHYSQDLQAIGFTIDLYRQMAHSRSGMLEAARAYRPAFQEQPSPAAVRPHLIGVLETLSGLRHGWTALADRYRSLWLRENRTYALDLVLDRYRAHAEALADAEARTAAALQAFDAGRPLPPPSAVRLAVEAVSGHYFREWLVAGPLPLRTQPTDYLAAAGGERAARPGVTDEFTFGSQTYRWHRTATPQFAVVDLAALYPEAPPEAVLYAYATIESPRAQRIRAAFGSDGAAEVFLNGTPIFERSARSLVLDGESFVLPLEAGRNHLLLKLSRPGGAGAWRFALRLKGPEVRSRKNRYRLL